jgi:thiamine-monophosphate kinase
VTVADFGEFGLISAVRGILPPDPPGIVGPGDDGAVLPAPDGRVVATTDLLIEGRHFRRDWSSAADIGTKAAAQNLADIAAMGATPTALLFGLAIPGEVAAAWVLDATRGMAAECARAGAVIAGGDVTSADEIMLAITALGDLAGRAPVTRAGARPGDLIALGAPTGRSAAGLALLQAGLTGDLDSPAESRPAPGTAARHPGGTAPAADLTAESRPGPGPAPRRPGGTAPAADLASESRPGPTAAGRPRSPLTPSLAAELAGLVTAHRRPQPDYAAGPAAAAAGATAMIDISDGLVADLGHIADSSGACLSVISASLPGIAVLKAAAGWLDADWRLWALGGGEDHALAATFPSRQKVPQGWTVIGDVRAGAGVLVDSRPFEGPAGWDHFRRGRD